MKLSAGARLGPYEVISAVGAGGMGEVWRARDTRLERTVAIKILPAELVHDEQSRLRFEREAKTISSLNHPHICTIHDVGREGGLDYLVLEMLEGESLADRIARGPLPLEQVLRIGQQVALALDAAHRRSIVHRDLKPANVMLTPAGAKLLDFGLAKIASSPQIVFDGATEGQPLTKEGTILGTFQYMAPEQLEGLDAGPRTDIFALGCLLYEMATGKRAFEGATKTSLIAQIVGGRPRPLRELQPLTPPGLEHVIDRCLEKDPDRRWQSANDVAEELRWISEAGSQAGAAVPVTRRRRLRERTAWTLAALLAIAIAALGWALSRRETTRPQLVRSELAAPAGMAIDLRNDNSGSLAISPDGRHVVFSATVGGKHSLWIRSLDSLESRRLEGTEGASFPFWSPDSRFIAFFREGALRKVERSGSPPLTICKAEDGRDGSWNEEGVILFSPATLSPIHRVAASGGTSQQVTELDPSRHETTHRWATFLPDGKHFLFMAGTHGESPLSENNAIYVTALDSPGRTLVLHGRSNVVYASGHLLYVREGTLLAQPFDAERRVAVGEPVPLATGVAYDTAYFRGAFSASQNGALVFRSATLDRSNDFTIHDRLGMEVRRLPRARNFANYGLVSFSPDGSRVALEMEVEGSQFSDIWIVDLERGTRSRFTFGDGWDYLPVWSPDGQRIAWAHSDFKTGAWQVHVKEVDGSAPSRSRFPVGGDTAWATAFSPDGRAIAVSQLKTGEGDIVMVPHEGDEAAVPLLNHPAYRERNATFSPDGKWVAWASWESGQPEIYVASYPGLRKKRQVSNAGTGYPAIAFWSAGEIVYLAPDGTFMSVTARPAGEQLHLGEPQPLFRVEGITAAGVSRDGKQFAVVAPPRTGDAAPADALTLVVNWPAGLTKEG